MGCLDITQTHNLVVATVTTEYLSEHHSWELTQALTERWRYHGAHFFVLDMSSVEVMSSRCLGALVNLLKELQPMRCRLVLTNLQSQVAELFKITRLDAVFDLFENVAEACDTLKVR